MDNLKTVLGPALKPGLFSIDATNVGHSRNENDQQSKKSVANKELLVEVGVEENLKNAPRR